MHLAQTISSLTKLACSNTAIRSSIVRCFGTHSSTSASLVSVRHGWWQKWTNPVLCRSLSGPVNPGAEQQKSTNASGSSTRSGSRAEGQKSKKEQQRIKNQQLGMYMGGLTLFTISFTYASVPLYRMFCQKTGFAGTVKTDDVNYEKRAKPVSGKRLFTIKFNADVSDALPWKFIPQQHEIKVVPGEAALAFYTATNKTNEPIIGVASYNVQPEQAGQYFNKIQCFCFEEQMLKPHEKVDMPVFFFIDPDSLKDLSLDGIDTITLSYTFFKVGDADAPEFAGMLVNNPHARSSSSAAAAAKQ